MDHLILSVVHVEMVAVEVVCWGGGHAYAGGGSGARAAGTTVKLPQNTDTVGLPLGGCEVDGGQY